MTGNLYITLFQDCPLGSFGQRNHSSCVSSASTCNSGTYGNSALRQCALCPSNQINNIGHTACISCGTNIPNVLQDQCISTTSCPKNSILNGGTCNLCKYGTAPNSGYSSCSSCSMGYYSTYSHDKCVRRFECGVGFYGNSQKQCLPCKSWTVAKLDRTKCVRNPIYCDIGAIGNFLNNQCEMCPDGKIPNQYGTACTSCLSGANANHSSCVANSAECENGTYFDNAKKQCFVCPDGKINSAPGDPCVACPAGYYAMVNHLICVNPSSKCDPGTIGNSTSKQCVKCNESEYADVGSNTCKRFSD